MCLSTNVLVFRGSSHNIDRDNIKRATEDILVYIYCCKGATNQPTNYVELSTT
jgi:hypothetical protein